MKYSKCSREGVPQVLLGEENKARPASGLVAEQWRRLPRGAGAGSALAETQVPFHSRDPYPEIVNFGAHRLESEHLVVDRSEGDSHRAKAVVSVRAELCHFALRCKPVQPLAYPPELPLDHAAKRGNALFLFSGSLYHPHILRTGERLSMSAWCSPVSEHVIPSASHLRSPARMVQ